MHFVFILRNMSHCSSKSASSATIASERSKSVIRATFTFAAASFAVRLAASAIFAATARASASSSSNSRSISAARLSSASRSRFNSRALLCSSRACVLRSVASSDCAAPLCCCLWCRCHEQKHNGKVQPVRSRLVRGLAAAIRQQGFWLVEPSLDYL